MWFYNMKIIAFMFRCKADFRKFRVNFSVVIRDARCQILHSEAVQLKLEVVSWIEHAAATFLVRSDYRYLFYLGLFWISAYLFIILLVLIFYFIFKSTFYHHLPWKQCELCFTDPIRWINSSFSLLPIFSAF